MLQRCPHQLRQYFPISRVSTLEIIGTYGSIFYRSWDVSNGTHRRCRLCLASAVRVQLCRMEDQIEGNLVSTPHGAAGLSRKDQLWPDA